MKKVVLGIALLCAVSSACAQEAPYQEKSKPGGDAAALARVIADQPDRARKIKDAEDALLTNLMSSVNVSRPPCDFSIPECASVARRLVQEAAIDLEARQREFRVNSLAIIFADKLTKAELKNALQFTQSDGSRAFVKAMLSATDVRTLSTAARTKIGTLTIQSALSEELPRRFYDETKGLPRQAFPGGSARPVPPPPSRSTPTAPKAGENK